MRTQQQLSGADGMEDEHNNAELINRLMEELNEEQTKEIIEYLYTLLGLTR